MINKEGHDPCDHTLKEHHIYRTFGSGFIFDRRNRSNAWCIQQTKDQERQGR